MPHNVGMVPKTDVTRSRGRMPAAARREVILGAAESAFAEAGFHETSLEGVAERAGVSKALIYEHFSSKRELYRALLAYSSDELLDRVSATVAGGRDREARLRFGIEAFVDFVVDHPGASRLLFGNLGDSDVTAELDRLRDEAATMIATLMSDEIPPSRDATDAELETAVAMLSYQLVGALQSLANWWELNPAVERDRVVRMAMEFAWLGLDRLSLGETWLTDGGR